jgi:hypothetical protein
MKILASKLSEPIGQLYVKSIDDPSVDDHKYPRVIFLQKMRRWDKNCRRREEGIWTYKREMKMGKNNKEIQMNN